MLSVWDLTPPTRMGAFYTLFFQYLLHCSSNIADSLLSIPYFLLLINAVLNSSCRSYATPRGAFVMRHMFEVLSTYELDCERAKTGKLLHEEDRERVKGALLKAIVMFCETFRFRSIYLTMLWRACDGKEWSTLDPASWKLVHNWIHESVEVHLMWKADLPPMHTPLPDWFHGVRVSRPGTHDPINIKTLNDLIGEVGELMLINAEADLIVTANERECKKLLKKRTSLPVPEPGFD